MKYIIDIDGKSSTKYKYTVWSVFEYCDGSVSKDSRILFTDDEEEFIEFITKLDNK